MNPNEHELIGTAGRVLSAMTAKIKHGSLDHALKLLFYGPPGTGKSDCAMRLSVLAAEHKFGIEHINGKDLNVDKVREWEQLMHYSNLFGNIGVKLVDEFDRASRDAQDLLLTLIDKLPKHRALIVTTNLGLGARSDDGRTVLPRLHSRFQCFEFKPPNQVEIAEFVRRRWPELGEGEALRVAAGSHGDVRMAMNDAESLIDVKFANQQQPAYA